MKLNLVNPANSNLTHGGGLAAAVVKRGGQAIQEESDNWVKLHGPLATGDVAVTSAGNLHCKYIIHAVGPVYKDGNSNEDALLLSAIWNSLKKAEDLKVTSIAFPAISSGIFKFPKDRCAEIFFDAMISYINYPRTPRLTEIHLTNNDSETVRSNQVGYFTREFDKRFK